MIPDPDRALSRLKEFQRATRQRVIDARGRTDLHAVTRDSAADTIYAIDAEVEPVLEEFCREWATETPLVLIAEGVDVTGASLDNGLLNIELRRPTIESEVRQIAIQGARSNEHRKVATTTLEPSGNRTQRKERE